MIPMNVIIDLIEHNMKPTIIHIPALDCPSALLPFHAIINATSPYTAAIAPKYLLC